jgi:hypothetical protein
VEEGQAARGALIFGPSYSSLTLNQMVEKYADKSENDVPAYQSALQRSTGLAGDTKLSYMNDSQRGALLTAMARHEGFREGAITFTAGKNGSGTVTISETETGSHIPKLISFHVN